MLSTIDRIRERSYLDPDTQCWVFTGATTTYGYGEIVFKIEGKSITGYVHRVSYQEHVGPIPAGLEICHSCDNPPCWNPDHLFAGTRLQNMQDKVGKGRHIRGEATYNAKLTEDQVREIRHMYATGDFTQQEISNTFGIARRSVSFIVLRQRWKHVKELPNA